MTNMHSESKLNYFTQELIQEINEHYLLMETNLDIANPALHKFIKQLDGVEELIMKFYAAFMPVADLYNLSSDVLFDTCCSSINNLPFALKHQIPPRIWLNYLAWYRVNNEAPMRSRSVLAEKISKSRLQLPNLADISKASHTDELEELALACNLWCAQHVSYQASDNRSLHPLFVLDRTYGRCGEESCLLVEVLRSMGLPARQIYVPLWSHCDDNHAWVEVWTSEGFKFIGACELESSLNRGWFVYASARAAFTISPCPLPSKPKLGWRAARAGEIACEDNNEFYFSTKTVRLEFRYLSQPISGVKVQVQILNYAYLADALILHSNSDGLVEFTCNYNDLSIYCMYKDDVHGLLLAEHKIKAEDSGHYTINLEKEQTFLQDFSVNDYWTCFKGEKKFNTTLSEAEQKWLAIERNLAAERLQKKRSKAVEEYWASPLAKFVKNFMDSKYNELNKRFFGLENVSFTWTKLELSHLIHNKFLQAPTRLIFWQEQILNLNDDELILRAFLLIINLSDKAMLDLRLDSWLDALSASPPLQVTLPQLATDSHNEAILFKDLVAKVYAQEIGLERCSKYRKLIQKTWLQYTKYSQKTSSNTDYTQSSSSDYIKRIQNSSSKSSPSNMTVNPYELAQYIDKNYSLSPTNFDYRYRTDIDRLWVTSHINKEEKSILLVALSRSLALPAYFDYENFTAHVYWEKAWLRFPCEENTKVQLRATLELRHSNSIALNNYNSKWSIMHYQAGEFKLMSKYEIAKAIHNHDHNHAYDRDNNYKHDNEQQNNLMQFSLATRHTLDLEPGNYRFFFCRRLPNGDQTCQSEQFNLRANGCHILEIKEEKLAIDKLISHFYLEPLKLNCWKKCCAENLDTDNATVSWFLEKTNIDLATASTKKFQLLIWLEATTEPSIHILNELTASNIDLVAKDLDIYLLVSADSLEASYYQSLKDLASANENIKIAHGNFEESIARAAFINHELSPWLILQDKKGRGYYSTSGYQVGVIELCWQLYWEISKSSERSEQLQCSE